MLTLSGNKRYVFFRLRSHKQVSWIAFFQNLEDHQLGHGNCCNYKAFLVIFSAVKNFIVITAKINSGSFFFFFQFGILP